MRNIWLVARQEFWTHVRKKSFLFAIFGMPLLMGIIMVISIGSQLLAIDTGITVNRLGYIDEAHVLVDTVPAPTGWVAFEDNDAARAALDNGEIDAYFLLPIGYKALGNVSIFAHGVTPDTLQDEIEIFLVENLTASIETDAPPERLNEPVEMRMFLENSQRELTGQGLVGLLVVPLIFAIVLLVALQFSATFLMSSVVEEKTNHIMEILITSIKPLELLTGKLLGLGVLGLLQIGVWLVIGVVVFAVAGDNEFLSAVEFPPDVVALALVYFLLTYFMFASILAGAGAVVGSEQESRQYAGWLMFPLGIPFFFIALLLTNPESPVLVVLTLIPFTSALTMMMRLPFTVIPAWQIGLSLLLLIITTGVVLWASSKVFRWALLLHGKKVGLPTLWRVIRGSPDIGTLPVGGKERWA